MIEAFICFGIYCFFLFVIFLLLLEGEDARKIKYYTDKMKRNLGNMGTEFINCTFDFTDSSYDIAIKMHPQENK